MRRQLAPSLILLVYSAVLLGLTGSIGFWGDAWTNFSFGYYYRWPSAILSFAENIRRPVEGLYITTLYEIFGANPLVFQLGSLVLHGIASTLFGLVFYQLQRPQLSQVATLTAFFLPTMAGTSYLTQMDNGRLQMLLFWLSINLWLWSELRWWRAGLALAVGVVSCFAYEAGVLLHLTLPIWLWLAGYQVSKKRFLFWSVVGVVLPLGAFGLARMFLFKGGLVEQQTWLPPLSNYVDYTFKAVDSLLMGVRVFPADVGSLGLGLGVAGGSAVILWRSPAPTKSKNGLILVLGILLFYLGGIPFFWAGGSNFIGGREFIVPIRTYTAGGYGLALLLAWLLSENATRQRIWTGCTVLFIGLGALYHAQLRQDWQAAHRSREAVWENLQALIPDVAPQTTLLLIDFQYEEGLATAIGGVTGTQLYLRMLYDEPTLFAHFAYLETPDFEDSEDRRVLLRPEGILARGHDPNAPIPPDSIILLLRRGEAVIILDSLSATDVIDGYPLAAEWGLDELQTNEALIGN